MNNYKKLLEDLLKHGIYCEPARDNMPSTKLMHSCQLKYDFGCGFPILTAKTMPFYSIVAELVGFMKGVTDVREFDRLGTKVWWDNAYKWNIKDKGFGDVIPKNLYKSETSQAKDLNERIYDLGRIYSAQWRDWAVPMKDGIKSNVDQLETLIHSINTQPQSRYHVMTTWNPYEMNYKYVSQPNCHVYFQATCTPIKDKIKEDTIRAALSQYFTDTTIDQLLSNGYNPDKTLYTHLTQRSCDMFLGVPFNITSYSIFTLLLAIFTNSLPMEFSWNGVNCHIYDNHFEACEEYISKDTLPLPKINITGINFLEDIEKLQTLDDIKKHFWLEDYKSQGKIKAKLSVGL